MISLKTPNWVVQVKEEINLCSSNTLPLHAAQPEYNCKYRIKLIYSELIVKYY